MLCLFLNDNPRITLILRELHCWCILASKTLSFLTRIQSQLTVVEQVRQSSPVVLATFFSPTWGIPRAFLKKSTYTDRTITPFMLFVSMLSHWNKWHKACDAQFCAEVNATGGLEVSSHWFSRVLATFTHCVSQYAQVAVVSKLYFVMMPLTVNRGISRREGISQTCCSGGILLWYLISTSPLGRPL